MSSSDWDQNPNPNQNQHQHPNQNYNPDAYDPYAGGQPQAYPGPMPPAEPWPNHQQGQQYGQQYGGGYAASGYDAPAQQPYDDRNGAQQPQQPQYDQYGQYPSYDPAPPEGDHTAVLPAIDDFPSQPAQAAQLARSAQEPAPEPPTGGRRAARGRAAVPAAGQRTGSPIIAPGMQPAALTAVLALLIAGAALVGRPGLALVVAVLQAVTAAGWFRLNGMWPARQGIVLAFLAGVTADTALLLTDGDDVPAVVVGTLGTWLLLVLVLQMRHRGTTDERLSSLTATSASTLMTVLATGFLAVAWTPGGSDPVVVGAVAVAVATLARALPLPGAASVVVALLAAAGSGIATGRLTDLGTQGALLGLAAGACAVIGLRVASYDFPSRFVHFTAGVALPLTAAAPVVYALGRVLTG
ncbi:hypothetical protein [Streptomyces sp. SPB162]|uniref:hypothetical protein n=1 Tax=Streptomyces sp. SPB162 TaxID=2940560 RepID=UPI002407549F|nr:hypothetical protein [Streptomyces sp. SPB162]MDF9814721.1 hypothetical protein [Streptomyces sp. SPB162]